MKVRTERTRTPRTRCQTCRRLTPHYDVVNYSSADQGSRQLCSRCFNTEVARADGLEGFEHVAFEPVDLVDREGHVHKFYFRTRLFGPGVAIDAFELRDGFPGGYEFQIIGDPTDDLLVLLGRLIEKMRRALSVQHLVPGSMGLQIADHQTVRAKIGWDAEEQGRVPLLSIDGQDITWEEFGHMLMTFEGWQFKLQIFDKSEEI